MHQCNNLYLQPTTNQYRYSYATCFQTPVYHAGKHQQASKRALAHRFVHEVHSSCAHWLQCTAVDCNDGIRIQSSCSQTRRKLPAISTVKPRQIPFFKFNWHPEQKFDAFIWTWICFQNIDNTVLRDYFWDCISFSSVSITFSFRTILTLFPSYLVTFCCSSCVLIHKIRLQPVECCQVYCLKRNFNFPKQRHYWKSYVTSTVHKHF